MILRDYQKRAIDEIGKGFSTGHKRQMLGMATGSGKTATASEVIRLSVANGRKCLFIVDRVELVGQAVRHLYQLGLSVGVLQGENTAYSELDDVLVASIQTIRSRGVPNDFGGLIVIDEAHILHKAHIELLKHWSAVPVIGLSATPLRQDLGKYFTNLVTGPSIAELTEKGSLVPANAFCPSLDAIKAALKGVKISKGDFATGELEKALNRKELIGDIIKTWQEKAADRPTLVFAVDIAHSKQIVSDFTAAGITAAHIDAYSDSEERYQKIEAFKCGEIQLLSSVSVLAIGFDAPIASCAIVARPTLSEALHIQQLGRVLRPCEGKDDALILDHAGNTVRFGLPKDFTIPELGTENKPLQPKVKPNQEKMVTCSDCGAVMEKSQVTCPYCGIDRKIRTSEVIYSDGQLIEYGSDNDGVDYYSTNEKKQWYRGFKWDCERRGKKPGQAYYLFQDKFHHKPEWKWQYLPALEPNEEQARWIKYNRIRRAKAWQKRAAA